jgi:hypothetical protein
MNYKVINHSEWVSDSHDDGTSLKGFVLTTKRHLYDLFGQPTYYDLDDKVNLCWVILFDNNKVATIYDWKRSIPESDELYQWHIGGHSDEVVAAVLNLISNTSNIVEGT